MNKFKIYDAFLFFNELDLLEIRLELMHNHVDYFIISECDTTFSGLPKPFYFEENKNRFSKYIDKIINIKHYNSGEIANLVNPYQGKKHEIFEQVVEYYNSIKNTAETDFGVPHWCRDFIHRDLVKIGMDVCNDEDIIIFSDLDEIPNPNKIRFDGESYILNQRNMMYYINNENITNTWYGTFITKFKNIRNDSLGFLRRKRMNYKLLNDSGWHLSFMGGKERIIKKLNSYGHQEYNNNSIISEINKNIINNKDILNRSLELKNINIDEFYPSNIIKLIKEKFPYLIK